MGFVRLAHVHRILVLRYIIMAINIPMIYGHTDDEATRHGPEGVCFGVALCRQKLTRELNLNTSANLFSIERRRSSGR